MWAQIKSRFFKKDKVDDTPLLRLSTALKTAGFHTDSYSRFSGLHDTILVWKDISGQGEVALGYVVPEGNPTFCFEMSRKDDPHITEICGLIETLQSEGVAILLSPMAYIILPPPKSIRKEEEATAG